MATMEEGTTTIKVYRDDKERMFRLFGGPTHDAFRRVMETKCSHPDEAREYTTALIPAQGEAMSEGQPVAQVYSVYRCKLCSRFVVPGIPV